MVVSEIVMENRLGATLVLKLDTVKGNPPGVTSYFKTFMDIVF